MWGICFSVSLFIPSMCLKYVDSQYTLLKVMKEFLIRTVHIVLTKKKKSSFIFSSKIKDMFFLFTKNFIGQHIHCFVPLLSAIFQATS